MDAAADTLLPFEELRAGDPVDVVTIEAGRCRSVIPDMYDAILPKLVVERLLHEITNF